MDNLDYRVSEFLREVAQAFTPMKPETFWDCEPGLRRLLSGGSLAAGLNTELGRLVSEPEYMGDWLANEWVLHRGGGTSLSVSIFDSPRRFIHALPYYAMYAPLGDGTLAYQRYRLPDGFRNEVFDPGLRLVPDGSGTVGRGEMIRIESRTHAYDFRFARPVVALKFMSTAVQMQEWLFSRDTLQAWQANDADLTFTQLRVAAYVLGRFAHQSSEEPLRLLAEHPHHAVRWAAIQNLGRLNRSLAVSLLKQAVNDPHPHIRRAAGKTLAHLKPRT